MQIKITAEDIELGRQSSRNDCAIARAIRRTLRHNNPEPAYIRVGNSFTHIGHKVYSNPPIMKEFIKRFDQSRILVSPFIFVFEEDRMRSPYRSDEFKFQYVPNFSTFDMEKGDWPKFTAI